MGQLTEDIIRFEDARTLPDLFRLRCARHPDGEAYRQYECPAAGWRSFSWAASAGQFHDALHPEPCDSAPAGLTLSLA